MNITHSKQNNQIFFILFFTTLFFINSAFAIGDSDLKDQVTAVDSALKSIANPALWAVVIAICGRCIYTQNVIGFGVAAAGAVALSQLSGWVQSQFTCVI
jgi:hypothetical protein